jgi:ABC-type antimicrobial peptide transport system permease subunit
MFQPGSYTSKKYMNDQFSYHVKVVTGMPDYFRFFRIPMQGKEVEAGATNMIYVSKAFNEQLQKDSVQGTVLLDDVEYQIAGVFEHLYKEQAGDTRNLGTAFLPDMPSRGGYIYFRISPHADMKATTDKLTAIIRKYVPETLPLEIHPLSGNGNSYEGTIQMMYYGILIVAFISLLVVALSIYSAISMDTMSRQKEVAIRKINGATPQVIAWLFGRVYILTYLIVFAIVLPLGKQVAIIAFQGFDAPYRWDWAIGIFFGMALLIFLITAFKIGQIMHVNPASIIKKE